MGEVREIPQHLENCDVQEEICPNKCRTSKGRKTRALRKDLEVHLNYYCELRSMECRQCSLVGPARSMMTHSEDSEIVELMITEKYTKKS